MEHRVDLSGMDRNLALEAVRVTEAAALSALAACLPRNDLSFAGRTHRLEFLPLS